MKKLILSTIFCLSAFLTFAQNPKFSPSTFTAEDEVTITLDVTGTPLAGLDDLYIWIFANGDIPGKEVKNGLVNGQWTNSSDGAKMTKIATNIFTFKFIGTTIFGLSPGELIHFGFLAKTKDGSKQTQDYKPYKFDPLVFVPSQFRVFPSKLDQTDMATVYFHQDLATDQNLQRMFDVKVTLTFYSDAGTVVATRTALVATKQSAILYAYSFIPERLVTLTPGTKLGKFSYQFTGSVKDASGANVPTAGPVTEVVYTVFN